MKKRQELSERQQEFCRLCAEGKTIAEAERAMGFSAGYGGRLIRKAQIKKAIELEGEAIARRKAKDSAQKTEILSFLTDVMRDKETADIKTRMKAAELLGKRENLFEKLPQKEGNRIVIVDDLP
nr:hypothetical protein [uncultured Anaerotignum sp.]